MSKCQNVQKWWRSPDLNEDFAPDAPELSAGSGAAAPSGTCWASSMDECIAAWNMSARRSVCVALQTLIS